MELGKVFKLDFLFLKVARIFPFGKDSKKDLKKDLILLHLKPQN